MAPPARNLSAITTATGGFVINGQAAYDCSGGSVASAGNVSGNGFDAAVLNTDEPQPHDEVETTRVIAKVGWYNLGVVARYANRVSVMYAKRIVEAGPAIDIYHRPRHPYTIALLASVPRLDLPRRGHRAVRPGREPVRRRAS
jgi:hypothetical protein